MALKPDGAQDALPVSLEVKYGETFYIKIRDRTERSLLNNAPF